MFKMEFNANGFSTKLEDDNDKSSLSNTPFFDSIKDKMSFLLGLIALIISFVNLPFGLFINYSTKLFEKLFETGTIHWMIVLCALSILLIAVAFTCGTFSIVNYSKSKKTLFDSFGLVLSIFSFVVGTLCLVLNIIGITVL